MNQIQNKYLILGSLCALLLTLVVGYAAFSTVLKIKGTSNINSNWDIQITNIEKIESKGAIDVEGTPKYESLTATFNTNFTTPGDYATYKIEITNNGSLDATLKTITMPENTNNDIIFYLNKNENNEDITGSLKQNDTLFKKGETGNIGYVYVTVLYRDYENQKTPEKDEDKTASIQITFDFEQSGGNGGIVTPPAFTGTGTVYRYSVDELNIGDSIEGIETTTDPNTLGKNFYLKHDVIDNKITASYVCFVTDTEHCMQGGNVDYYATNLALLRDNQNTWFTNNGGSCWGHSETLSECHGNGLDHVYASSDGDVCVDNDPYKTCGDGFGESDINQCCIIHMDGRSSCSD